MMIIKANEKQNRLDDKEPYTHNHYFKITIVQSMEVTICDCGKILKVKRI